VIGRNATLPGIKKFAPSENKTDLYIKESTENNSLIPAKNFKPVKLPKSRNTKGISKEEISNAWKSIYNEERN
jgi:hypothetical protein